eukprot:jgi/Botrbrau1/16751/Bobra.0277s0007.1
MSTLPFARLPPVVFVLQPSPLQRSSSLKPASPSGLKLSIFEEQHWARWLLNSIGYRDASLSCRDGQSIIPRDPFRTSTLVETLAKHSTEPLAYAREPLAVQEHSGDNTCVLEGWPADIGHSPLLSSPRKCNHSPPRPPLAPASKKVRLPQTGVPAKGTSVHGSWRPRASATPQSLRQRTHHSRCEVKSFKTEHVDVFLSREPDRGSVAWDPRGAVATAIDFRVGHCAAQLSPRDRSSATTLLDWIDSDDDDDCDSPYERNASFDWDHWQQPLTGDEALEKEGQGGTHEEAMPKIELPALLCMGHERSAAVETLICCTMALLFQL